jgi:hypothetical protein
MLFRIYLRRNFCFITVLVQPSIGKSQRRTSDKVLNYGYEILDALIIIQFDFLADEHTPSKGQRRVVVLINSLYHAVCISHHS